MAISTQYKYDSWASQINGIPLNVHFYYMDLNLAGVGAKNLKPFSKSTGILNLIYFPFLEESELNLHKYEYDQKHFGTVADTGTAIESGVFVYKLYGEEKPQPKKIGDFPRYPAFNRQSGRHWSNESKLYQYPYHFCTVNDYINAPLVLKNEYIPANFATTVPVMVHQPITMSGGYTIYVEGYKGDANRGANEGMFASAGLDLPTASSQYAQFMATSKSQFLAEQNSANRNESMAFGRAFFSTLGGVAQGVANFKKNPAGVVDGAEQAVGGVLDFVQGSIDRKNRIEQAQGKVSDLINAPRSVSMPSADVLMSLQRNDGQVCVNRYMILPYYRQKLADYWHLFGYKQNRVMTPDTKSRKYWNYIKTMDANIQSSAMDKTEIEILNKIYDKGIRFWHQSAGRMYDYEKDNVEV